MAGGLVSVVPGVADRLTGFVAPARGVGLAAAGDAGTPAVAVAPVVGAAAYGGASSGAAPSPSAMFLMVTTATDR